MENRKREVGLWMGKEMDERGGTAKAGPVNGNR